MSPAESPHIVRTLGQLASLFGEVGEASHKKEVSYIHPHYRALIEASPFAVLATSGADGLDVSPRGDPPGFVVVQNEYTLLLPERRGNNRVDGLKNILHDPRVALLFLIPGVGETLRVNGRAAISIEPVLLKQLSVAGNLPKCVLIITVEAAFFQCSRAILRSKLWQHESWASVPGVPSVGSILASLTSGEIDGEKYDRELPGRQRTTLY